MNRNSNNFKSLDKKKIALAQAKVEWERTKKQEQDLKKEFYSSPENSSERARIKNQLTRFQREKFDKGECGKSMSIDIENEELFERLKNPTGPATDPQHLAKQIKEELKAVLNGSRKMRTGDRVGDIWEANHSKEFCYFGKSKEIKEMIANLPRKRQEPLDLDKITTRMVRVKRKDLNSADFEEIISLIRQVKDFLKAKDKQDHQNTKNIKLNNPHLFTQWKCSTDKRNGIKRWENWHTFSGKHNGFNYTIYVPDHHFALTNCLFDDGWGTNSEVSKFFVVEGAVKPTELHYWNVDKQRDEIISEAEAQKLTERDKECYIEYKTYVDINDKITISHYDEKSDKLGLVKPVSGINKELVLEGDNDRQNIMSGGSMVAVAEKNDGNQLNNLLEYFQKNNIRQVSLTPEGDLAIEYNDSQKTKIIDNKSVKEYLVRTGQESLNYSQLSELLTEQNNSSSSPQNKNFDKVWKIGGGVIVISAVAALGYQWYSSKKSSKKAK
ncbi:MAG: hypothetical protein I3270_02765 [Candidatus Moeniiplasma glomeromycotorum]|nr:hypothetical protein [Candidatus Moeniiplasma glomeromycotorum]MCE8162556.1 hypothetical protein [Candidatus Moeniiplasma glomeromycotorum]MCE8166544.1 hypothetical protein [Candidatus Moeniiplasma glomeromycotorum]MCE8166876.1 hypothetical protein [Candidatus Moeniiplasma glomeromycotorum]